jgi:hypothetical protein
MGAGAWCWDAGNRGTAPRVEIDDVAHLAGAMAGVRRTGRQGLAGWRCQGRLVARQRVAAARYYAPGSTTGTRYCGSFRKRSAFLAGTAST